MSQARSGRLLYEKPAHVAQPISWWVIPALVLAVACLCLASAAVAVHFDREQLARDVAAEPIVVLKATCPAPEIHTRWTCDAVERREYLNTCVNRIKQDIRIPTTEGAKQ